MAMGLLAASVLFVFAPALMSPMNIPAYLRGDALGSLRIFAASIPLVFLASSATGLLQGANRFELTSAIAIPTAVATQAVPWLVAVRCPRLSAVAAALLVIRAVSTAAGLAVIAKTVPGILPLRRSHFSACGRLLRFGGWLTVSNVLNPFVTYADRFLIGAFMPLSAVAYYSIPYDGIMRLTALPLCLAAGAFPILSSLAAARDKIRIQKSLVAAVGVISFGMAVPMLLICGLGNDLTALWLGADFAARTNPVAQVLSIGVYINALAVFPYATLQASGRPDITAKLHLLEVVPHLAVLFVCVRTWGIAGAALAWTLRASLDATLLWWATLRVTGISVKPLRDQGRYATYSLAAALALTLLMGTVHFAPIMRVLITLSLTAAWLVLWPATNVTLRDLVRGVPHALFRHVSPASKC
jgi:O-antigen/teichoic acid export membrane protein